MVQAIAISIVVIGIAIYLALFFRGRKAGSEIIDELEAQADEPETAKGEQETPFSSVETSSTGTDAALAHDSSSVTKNITFEDTIKGEKVVVEVPSKDARKRRVAKKVTPAIKKAPKKKPVTTGDLVKALEEKIEKRTALLKDLKLNTETDATLKRYNKMLVALKAKKTLPKKVETKKVPVVKVRVVEEEVKPAKKAKKPAKKTTKKTKKSAK